MNGQLTWRTPNDSVRCGRVWPIAPVIALLLLAACAAESAPDAGDSSASNGGTAESADPYRDARLAMVERQIAARGIRDAKVLEAMRRVPRHEFVRPTDRSQAYRDHPLPIGHDQTISQPYIVAFMTEALALEGDEKVLEIGTGSGYQAAVLAEIVPEVYTIEIVEPLGRQATALLEELGYENVRVRVGDGYKGWPEEAPFDAIIVTCAPENVPAPLVEQLRTGGRMCIPVGPTGGSQSLYLLEKTEAGEMEMRAILPVRFVPMTGEAQRK